MRDDIGSLFINLLRDIGSEFFHMGSKMVVKNLPRRKRPPAPIVPKHIDGIPIGLVVGTKKQLLLPASDARHKVVQGASGMGKSEWAINYVVNRAKLGQGTAYLDNADGAAAQRILSALPEEAMRRCVVLDHSDKYFPLSVNIGLGIGAQRDIFVLDALVGMWLSFFIDNLGVEGQWMTQELIQNAVKAALYAHRGVATILEVLSIVSDYDYRQNALKCVRDDDVLRWWSNYDSMSPDKQRFVSESFMRRAGVITTQKVLQHMLYQIPKRSYQYRKWIDDGYTVIIICKESMGSLVVRIVMSVHLMNFWLAAMSRDEELPNDAPRKPFVVVTDEPQTWLPGNEQILDNIYSKGRKYGLGIVSMFQSTAQIAERSPKLLEKILDNAPDLILFTTNKSAIDLDGFSLRDIKKHHFVARIGDYPPIECAALPMATEVRDRRDFAHAQMRRWGTPWEDVVEDIKNRRGVFHAAHQKRRNAAHPSRQAEGGDYKPTPKTLLPLLPNGDETDANTG